MKLSEIQKRARKVGIRETWKKTTKKDLIKAIQRQEGNFDCFGKAGSHCDRFECKYHKWCLSLANVTLSVENYS